jgi:CheY-like chemotaxis protein
MAGAAAAIVNVPIARGLRAVPRRIRVATVDANQLIQEGLAAMIHREDDMTLVAAASCGKEAIDDVHRSRPDVVILDLLLPDMPGEDLARRILAEFPSTRIVAITSAQGGVHARRALAAGVHGLLSDSVSIGELVHAIRMVQAGARMIPGPVPCRAAAYCDWRMGLIAARPAGVPPMPEGAREWLAGRVVAWLLGITFVFSLGAAIIVARGGTALAQGDRNGSPVATSEQEQWRH